MCWSGEASALVAAGGYASAIYSYKRGDSKMIWAPVAYFATMEALQSYTYTVIDQCGVAQNQYATLIAYIHIAFQPIFINAFSLYFVPEKIRKKIENWVYGISAVAGVLFLMRIYPFPWLKMCKDVSYYLLFWKDIRFAGPLCGDRLCAVSGNWHIAWELPLRFHVLWDNMYVFASFLLPFLYGAWKITLYLIIAGPLLAAFTTNNPNEWPAIWCLFSTLIIGFAVQPKLRSYFFQQSWYRLFKEKRKRRVKQT